MTTFLEWLALTIIGASLGIWRETGRFVTSTLWLGALLAWTPRHAADARREKWSADPIQAGAFRRVRRRAGDLRRPRRPSASFMLRRGRIAHRNIRSATE